MARQFDREQDEDRGFGPMNGRGRFSGRYTREQDPKTGGCQFGRRSHSRDENEDEGWSGGRFGYRGNGAFERENDDDQRGMGSQDRDRD